MYFCNYQQTNYIMYNQKEPKIYKYGFLKV